MLTISYHATLWGRNIEDFVMDMMAGIVLLLIVIGSFGIITLLILGAPKL